MANPDRIDEFAARLNGEVIRPRTPEFEIARKIFNGRVDRRPALIARCRGASDVIQCVSFARDEGLPVSVRGGGHGPTGFSLCNDGLLIDLSLMRGVWVEPAARTATVQGGAHWKDVYREAAVFDLVPPGGDCDMVGVAGSTLGGGWGYLSRTQGLAIDNLNAVQLVTADGRLLTASATEHPELFWALRGGGVGSFGVATAFEFRLQRLPRQVYAGEIVWRYDRAVDVLMAYRDWIRSGPPDELYLDFNLYDDDAGTTVATIGCVYVGSAAAGKKALERFFDIGGSKGEPETKPYLSVIEDYSNTLVPYKRELWKSAFVTPGISADTIRALVATWARPPMSSSPLLFIETVGGRMGHVAPEETAYPHRHELMCLTFIGCWKDERQDAVNEAWVREVQEALAPATTGGVYVNYPDADLHNWQWAYYKENYSKLRDIKGRYDHGNFFHFPQSIEPSDTTQERPCRTSTS